MRRFEARVQAGTKVFVTGLGWCTVKAVHETRKWIEIEDYFGSFQFGNVQKFTNGGSDGKMRAHAGA